MSLSLATVAAVDVELMRDRNLEAAFVVESSVNRSSSSLDCIHIPQLICGAVEVIS